MKDDKSKLSITRVDAIPKSYGKKEKGFFDAFKSLFLPRFKQLETGAEELFNAKVRMEHGAAEVKIEEAAKIAAETSKLQQDELSQFCKTIDSHFEEADTETKTKLKMAKLLETNPEIANQLNKVSEILANLEQNFETSVKLIDSENNLPTAKKKESI